MTNLADVEIFVAVVDHGGFTAAAQVLGISKSYASKRVRALEDRVGADLLVRNTRHVAPTVIGEAFRDRCRSALELLDDAEQLAAQERGEPRGTLRVSLPGAFGLRYLAPIVAEYLAAHEELKIEASYTDRKVSLIDEGYDVALRIGSHLPDSDLVARRLASMEAWVVASEDYVARRGEPTRPEDLRDHDCLVYTLTAEHRRWTLPTADGAQVTVPVVGRMTSDAGDALVEACRQGLGVAVLPDWMLAEDVRDGRLRRVLTEVPASVQHMWAVYPRHRHHAPKVTQLVDLVARRMDPVPWALGAA